MLLRSSPVHMVRLRRLAWGLAALGVLLLLVALALGCWLNFRAEQARADHLNRIFLRLPSDPLPDPPFLTFERQGSIYTPGQTVLAFAEGFQPHEPLFVRLYHRTQGLVDAYQTRADVRGQFPAARPLSTDDEQEDFTPPGSLWFQVEGLNGYSQEYPFRLEPGPAAVLPPSKGSYPTSAVPGSVVMLWCSGQETGKTPSVSASVDGENLRPQAMRLTLYPVASDGLLLASLVISLDDPIGNWVVFLNACEFHIPVFRTVR